MKKKSHKKVKKKGQTYCRPFSSPNNNKNINSFFTGYQTPVELEYLVSQVLSCLALFGFFYFIFALGGHRILTTIFHPLIFFGDFMNFVCVVVGLFSQLYPATFVLLFSDVIKKKRNRERLINAPCPPLAVRRSYGWFVVVVCYCEIIIRRRKRKLLWAAAALSSRVGPRALNTKKKGPAQAKNNCWSLLTIVCFLSLSLSVSPIYCQLRFPSHDRCRYTITNLSGSVDARAKRMTVALLFIVIDFPL